MPLSVPLPMPLSIARSARIAVLALGFTAVTAGAQAPLSTHTSGYLDFVGVTSGAPTANNMATGPYRARFQPTGGSMGIAAFTVYCFDWLGAAGDSHVQLLTFSDAVSEPGAVSTALRTKFADDPEGTVGGLTTAKLRSAAWLTTQMTVANQSRWNEMHVALWRLFWDAGIGSPALPSLTFQSGSGDPSAQYWFDLANQNAGFEAADFRVVAPVTEQGAFRNDRQVFLAQVQPGAPFVIPEPGTLGLTAIGLFAFGVVVRRRARRASAS